MKILRHSRTGFTLLEVLMVTAISIIFLGVSFAGYRDFSRRQEVVVAKRGILSNLRKAQKDATSGNKPSACGDTLVGYAFEITFAGPPASYQISAICKNPLGGPDIEILQDTFSLNNNISVSLPSVNPIIFYTLNRGTNIQKGGNQDVTISSGALGTGDSQVININWTGEID